MGFEPWRTAEGRLIGWVRGDPSPAARRVLVFHGNAGCAIDRDYFAEALDARSDGAARRTYILEYPGYGARPGRASEKTFVAAAIEALETLRAERPDPIWLIGESLGSGVACGLARRRPEAIAGLLLITPFTALADVAAAHYPFLPARWFLRDRFDSRAGLRDYSGPLVVVIAGRDQVIPPRLGRALYAAYAGPKRLFEQMEADHNTLDLSASAPWWEDALRFLLMEAPAAERARKD